MAIPESKHHTIRTLYSLGFNRLTIASAIGVPKSTLYDHFSEIIGEDTIGGELKLSHYRDSSLVALSIESSDTKDKISALKTIDITTDDTSTPDLPETDSIIKEITDELHSL